MKSPTRSRRTVATILHDRRSPTPTMLSRDLGEISSIIYAWSAKQVAHASQRYTLVLQTGNSSALHNLSQFHPLTPSTNPDHEPPNVPPRGGPLATNQRNGGMLAAMCHFEKPQPHSPFEGTRREKSLQLHSQVVKAEFETQQAYLQMVILDSRRSHSNYAHYSNFCACPRTPCYERCSR